MRPQENITGGTLCALQVILPTTEAAKTQAVAPQLSDPFIVEYLMELQACM